tara:strand:+ start:449 stop:658 length:210 start_codon:yes stop_codon:yes gene_type:complete
MAILQTLRLNQVILWKPTLLNLSACVCPLNHIKEVAILVHAQFFNRTLWNNSGKLYVLTFNKFGSHNNP